MQRLRAWVSRDPGRALLAVALVATAVLYGRTLGTSIVNYDDPWLYRDNFVVQDASWSSMVAIFTDLDVDSPLRHTLTPEYLPVRDLSVMLDFAVWGHHYAGFHLTNLALYLLGLVLVFRMLDAFGFDRTTVGLAVLIFAVHPAHAESVSWLSERKGLLGLVFAAGAGVAYARFRAGASWRWLIPAVLATVAAVWSKAPAAFTIAAIASLELVQPARRVTWKRSLTGLAIIGTVGLVAFIPVVALASRAAVVGPSVIPGDSIAEIVLGVHGFYLRLGAMTFPNAVSYPLSTQGPTAVDVVLGALGLIGAIAVFVPRLRAPPELRAGAAIWLVAWLPVSHLVLPLHMIGLADRYALVMVLGLALAIAAGVRRIPTRRAQIAVVTVIGLASGIRAFDASTSWSSDLELWQRAVESNPRDASAWNAYANALDQNGRPDEARRAVEAGLGYGERPQLLLRLALQQLADGERATGVATMRRAAIGGDVIAMGNLAQLLLDDGARDEALVWGRRADASAPMMVHARRSHGMVALATGHAQEALAAFETALALEPTAANRYNVGLAQLRLGRRDQARVNFEACLGDPRVGRLASARLGELRAAGTP